MQIAKEYEQWADTFKHNTTAQDLAQRLPKLVEETRMAIQEKSQGVMQPTIKAMKAFFATAHIDSDCDYSRFFYMLIQANSPGYAAYISKCNIKGDLDWQSDFGNKKRDA